MTSGGAVIFQYVLPVHHQIDYPEIAEGVRPKHRFMSAYEQRLEPPDRQWQYLLFAAEPYETIAFKVSLSRGLHRGGPLQVGHDHSNVSM